MADGGPHTGGTAVAVMLHISILSLGFLRYHAWPLQPGGGSDHPRLCLPGSNGGPVFFCGPTHQGEEQAQAQETPSEEAHVPAAAAVHRGEEPHRLRGPALAPALLTGLGKRAAPERRASVLKCGGGRRLRTLRPAGRALLDPRLNEEPLGVEQCCPTTSTYPHLGPDVPVWDLLYISL